MAHVYPALMSAVCSGRSSCYRMGEAYIAALEHVADMSADSAIEGMLHMVSAGEEACMFVICLSSPGSDWPETAA